MHSSPPPPPVLSGTVDAKLKKGVLLQDEGGSSFGAVTSSSVRELPPSPDHVLLSKILPRDDQGWYVTMALPRAVRLAQSAHESELGGCVVLGSLG